MNKNKPILNITSLVLPALGMLIFIDDDNTQFINLLCEKEIILCLSVIGFVAAIFSIRRKEKIEALAWIGLLINGVGGFQLLMQL